MATNWIIIAALLVLAAVVVLLFRTVSADGFDGSGTDRRHGPAQRKDGAAGS